MTSPRCLLPALVALALSCSRGRSTEPAVAEADEASETAAAPAATTEASVFRSVPAPSSSAFAYEPAVVYAARCAPCHGAGGSGNGPRASSLDPRPTSFTDPAWQKKAKDADLKTAIATGKGKGMPAFRDLADRPGVIDGLVKVIRGFGL